jgi:hypothetical protein
MLRLRLYTGTTKRLIKEIAAAQAITTADNPLGTMPNQLGALQVPLPRCD